MARILALSALLSITALALDQMPVTSLSGNAELETLFATDQQLSAFASSGWSKNAWNGLVTFGRAPPARCWGVDKEVPFDIAVVGAPFDTGTSFRPGSRFGPNGIRQGSRRIMVGAVNVPWKTVVTDLADVVDCGDVPMIPFDNKVAIRQLEEANKDILQRNASRQAQDRSIAKDGLYHPRVLTLGGDHTITLPLLRGIVEVYGPVSVIHFDSHIDTWGPKNASTDAADVPINHATYFWHAAKEGLLAPNQSNIHVGIRGGMHDWDDYEDDAKVGFHISHAEDIEEIGYKGIVERIKKVVGTNPVYITLDIDVLDPGMAPATGTPEPGGFTTREMKKILQGLSSLKVVGADIVEVAPPYDSQDEITSIAAANLGWDILALIAKTPLTA